MLVILIDFLIILLLKILKNKTNMKTSVRAIR